MAQDARPRKGHPVLVFLIVLLVLVCLVGAYALALVNSGKRAIASAQSMEAAVQHVEDAVSAGTANFAVIRSNGQQLTRAASDLRQETDGWVWQVGTYIPVYGQDVAAVRTLAQAADDLCTDAVTPVLDALPGSDFSTLGLLDQASEGLEAIDRLTDIMPDVVDAVHAATVKVDGIGTLHIGQLNGAVQKIREPLDELDATLTNASDVVSELTSALGL